MPVYICLCSYLEHRSKILNMVVFVCFRIKINYNVCCGLVYSFKNKFISKCVDLVLKLKCRIA